ncbi:hypothetical protein ACUHGC_11380 [Testudinibacter sp. P27/CKL/0425]
MDSTIFPTPKLRVGVFPNPQGFELAFLDKQRQPHFYHLEHLEQLPVVLRQQFAEKIGKKTAIFLYFLFRTALVVAKTPAAAARCGA